MFDDYIFIEIPEELPFNFVYEFDNNGNCEKYSENIKCNNNEIYVAYFNMNAYVAGIAKSYKNTHDIHTQFIKDYTRQINKINNVIHVKHDYFTSQLHKILTEYDYDEKYYTMIILLCCQSSFYLPYCMLRNIYIVDDSNALVSSGKNLKMQTMSVCVDGETINIDMNTSLFIKNISTNKITHQIDLTIFCEIDKKENKNIKICLLNWSVQII